MSGARQELLDYLSEIKAENTGFDVFLEDNFGIDSSQLADCSDNLLQQILNLYHLIK